MRYINTRIGNSTRTNNFSERKRPLIKNNMSGNDGLMSGGVVASISSVIRSMVKEYLAGSFRS